MPLKSLDIKKEELQELITLMEMETDYHSPNELWIAVSESQWMGRFPRRLSARTIADKIKELGIVYRTRLIRRENKEKFRRQTEKVDYLYRVVYKNRKEKRPRYRDIRIDWTISRVEDVKKLSELLKAEVWSWIRLKDE